MLKVGGFVPFSATDYPGCLSAVIFCQGCVWSCTYCHNPHLQPFSEGQNNWKHILEFLATRQGLLDAVVFSGGEPTLQRALVEAAQEVKNLGYQLGLHTACPDLARFEKLLPLFDWVGLDVKALPANYEKVTGKAGSGKRMLETVKLLLSSKCAYEIRTTICDDSNASDLPSLARLLAQCGVQNHVVQMARTKENQPAPINTMFLAQQIDLAKDFLPDIQVR